MYWTQCFLTVLTAYRPEAFAVGSVTVSMPEAESLPLERKPHGHKYEVQQTVYQAAVTLDSPTR